MMSLRPLKLILCSTLLTWSDGSEIQELISDDEVAEAVVISINEEDCSRLFSDIPGPLLTEQRAELCGVILPLQAFVPGYIGIDNFSNLLANLLRDQIGPTPSHSVPLHKKMVICYIQGIWDKTGQRPSHGTRPPSKPVRDVGNSSVCGLNIVIP